MDEKYRWSMIVLICLAIIAITTVSMVLSMSLRYQLVGDAFAIVIVIISGHSMFKGDMRKLRISILLISFLFALSLFDDILTNTVANGLHLQLLAFILLLFDVEAMPLLLSHRKLHINDASHNSGLTLVSWKVIKSRVSALAILFSGCYVLTITTLYFSTYAYSFAPILGDPSIYLVAVSIFLALFITLREDSMVGREYH